MIATCITSGIGAIILCLLPILKTKHKSILCLAGLCLAILLVCFVFDWLSYEMIRIYSSFIFGLIGTIFGLIWAYDNDRHAISTAGISAIVGTFLSFISGVCIFVINLNEST